MNKFRRKNILLAFIVTVSIFFSGGSIANAASIGVDVSNWQGIVNVSTLKKSGAKFLINKATEGTGYLDKTMSRNIANAKSVGLDVGVYHFARPEKNSAVAEANYFVNKTRQYIGKNVLPILDWEPATYASGRNQSCNVSWAKEWLDTVYKSYGSKPMIYMSAAVVKSCNWKSVADSNYGLWIAGYPRRNVGSFKNYPATLPYSTGAWNFAAMWQWSSSAYNGDGRYDANVFYGDSSTWRKYTNTSIIPESVKRPIEKVTKPLSVCVVVRRGQYVSMFFKDFKHVSVPSGDVNRVYPGDKICYNAATQKSTYKTHVVKRGESLSIIFGSDWQRVAKLNGLKNPNLIFVGQRLKY